MHFSTPTKEHVLETLTSEPQFDHTPLPIVNPLLQQEIPCNEAVTPFQYEAQDKADGFKTDYFHFS